MMLKIMNGMAPEYLEDMAFTGNIGRSVYNRKISKQNLALPKVKTNYFWNCFAYTGATVLNVLTEEMKYEKSMGAL